MQVNLTANDVETLRSALESIQISSTSAHKALQKIWSIDFSTSKINNTIGTLTANVTALTNQTTTLAASAQAAAQAFASMRTPKGLNATPKPPRAPRGGQGQGGGQGGGGQGGGQNQGGGQGGGSTRYRRMPFSAARSQEQYVRSMSDYYGASGSKFKNILDKVGLGGLGGGPGGQWVSKFGNPGQMPLVSRFRVFQRPFPGSERNPFSLGDSGNVLNNAVFSSGKMLETTFRGIVEAGSASVKTLGGLAAGAFQFGGVIASVFSPAIGAALSMLSSTIQTLSDMMGNVMSALGEAIGGVIQGLTTFALMLSGLASRAVIAASNLTELKNAAQITSGAIGAQKLAGVADRFQSDYGLSSTDSMRMMSRIAQQYRQVTGGSGEQAADAASKVFERVAEAGSVLNMNLDDMSKTVQSALAGRYTPLRRIGVSVSAPYLDQVAKMKGYDKTAKNPFEARLKALMDEIERQTKPFAGDLSATRYEFANQNRKLLGLFEAIFIQAGRILEPFAKSLLYVTNVGLSKFMEFVKGFADSMAGDIEFFQNTGIPRDMFAKVSSFTDSIVLAANHLISFASYLWDSRAAIGSWIKTAASNILGLAKDLIFASSQFIAGMATVVESFAQMLSPLGSFREALISLAKHMDWITGRDPEGDARRKYDAATASEGIYRYQLKEFETKDKAVPWLPAALGGMKFNSPEERESYAKGVEASRIQAATSNAQIAKRNELIKVKGFTEDQANVEVFGEKIGGLSFGSVTEVAGSMRKVAGQMADLANNPNLIKDVDIPYEYKETINSDELKKKVFGSTPRTPEFQSLNLPQKGQMAQYFSPQAFRDEVQNRQVSALESVASSSAQAVSVLTEVKMLLQNKNPAGPIDQFMQAPGWPIIVK